MTFKVNTTQKDQLVTSYEALMTDRCTIQTRGNARSTVGEMVPTFTSAATDVPCAFEFSPFKFRAREFADVGVETSEILVRARISNDYLNTISQDDRIVLTKRYGTALTEPETYEVQGFAEHSASGMILNLRRVEV